MHRTDDRPPGQLGIPPSLSVQAVICIRFSVPKVGESFSLMRHLPQGFSLSLQAKVEMLDNLLDIEVAYSLLRGGSDDSSKDPIDVNYEKLKTDIKVTGPPFLKHPPRSPQVLGPQTSMCAQVPWRASQHRSWGRTPAWLSRPRCCPWRAAGRFPDSRAHRLQGRRPRPGLSLL